MFLTDTVDACAVYICWDVSIVKYLPIFRKNLLPDSFTLLGLLFPQNEGNILLRYVCSYLPLHKLQSPTVLEFSSIHCDRLKSRN